MPAEPQPRPRRDDDYAEPVKIAAGDHTDLQRVVELAVDDNFDLIEPVVLKEHRLTSIG